MAGDSIGYMKFFLNLISPKVLKNSDLNKNVDEVQNRTLVHYSIIYIKVNF